MFDYESIKYGIIHTTSFFLKKQKTKTKTKQKIETKNKQKNKTKQNKTKKNHTHTHTHTPACKTCELGISVHAYPNGDI